MENNIQGLRDGQSGSDTSYPGNKTQKNLPPLLPQREERAGERRVSMREVHGEGEGNAEYSSARQLHWLIEMGLNPHASITRQQGDKFQKGFRGTGCCGDKLSPPRSGWRQLVATNPAGVNPASCQFILSKLHSCVPLRLCAAPRLCVKSHGPIRVYLACRAGASERRRALIRG